MRRRFSYFALASFALTGAVANADAVVTFDDGPEGWDGGVVESSGGNPGAHLHEHNPFAFWVEFSNSVDPEFVGDYTQFDSVMLKIDLEVEQLEFSRPWTVELRDYDDPPFPYFWVSVWYQFGVVSEATHGSWTTFSVTIEDTAATELPEGWEATPSDSPPAFSGVLAGVDRIVFATMRPDGAYFETYQDIRVDNISIFNDPAPGTVPGLLLAKSEQAPGDLVLSWQPSCGATALDYGIYGGDLGSWYSHSRIRCSDAGSDLTETISPDAEDRYYLVVPLDSDNEGSYGGKSNDDERPVGGGIVRCRPSRDTTPCQ